MSGFKSLLLLGCIGCLSAGGACGQAHSFDPFDLRTQAHDASLPNGRDANVAADAAASSSVVDSGPGPIGAGQLASDAATPVELARGAGAEAWVGELWATWPMLCDPKHPWSEGRPTTFPGPGYSERVALIVERGDAGPGHARIQFGEGTVPTDPGDEPYANGDTGSFWMCSIQFPTKGAQYRVLNFSQTRDSVRFDIVSSELWDPWCHAHDSPCPGHTCGPTYGPVCACAAGQCRAVEQGRIGFNLALTADTLEGDAPIGPGDTPGQLRLRRVK